MKTLKTLLFVESCLLAACTTLPNDPSVMVLPGSSKTMEQFRADDLACRQFALAQAGGGVAGSAEAPSSSYEAQQRYDVAYIQCMYAQGNRVPVSDGSFFEDRSECTPPPPPPE